MGKSEQALGLATLEDITSIILKSHDLSETLENIAALVSRQMKVDVCSIYLLEEDKETLTLQATKGLSKSSVGKVSMNIREGLTGLVIQGKETVNVEYAPEHPRYKYFRESKEERYSSFLGIPILDKHNPIGVIVIQTKEKRMFEENEISTLSTIAYQISSIVIHAKLLDYINHMNNTSADYEGGEKRGKEKADAAFTGTASFNLSGIAASPGFAIGKITVLDNEFELSGISEIKPGTVEDELEQFSRSIEDARIETLYLEKEVAARISEQDAAVFHSHLMILEDRGFLKNIKDSIRSGASAAAAVMKTTEHYIHAFSRMEDPYLKARSADMEDIRRRILKCILGEKPRQIKFSEKRIIAARDILPSDMASLDHAKIAGIITERGNMNSHAAIMAKSLGIPALLGVDSLLKHIQSEDEVILDGNTGHLYLRPDKTIKNEYERIQKYHAVKRKELESLRDVPCETLDGVRISLRANIGLFSEVKIAQANGAEGVGLYRTEFPYMARSTFPDRHEQLILYKRLLQSFPNQPVTIRTLDIGGDKMLPYFHHPDEKNPFMGWRSIRISLSCSEIFQEQLKGILMASRFGNPRIMFPMINSLDEIRSAKELLKEARYELVHEKQALRDDIPVGIMIELPSAVQIADLLCKEVDFLSIGTNDLIQYTLAVDRNNPKMKNMYTPYHPAVLRSLKHVADTASKQKVSVSVCGEMAADPLNAMILAGFGIKDFSMAAPALLPVKAALNRVTLTRCREIADTVLEMGTTREIEAYIGAVKSELSLM